MILSALGMVNALGNTPQEILARLLAGDVSGMVRDHQLLLNGSATVGRASCVSQVLPIEHDSRNNQLLAAACAQITGEIEALRHRIGTARIGIVIGTSTSGIAEGASAIAELKSHGKLPAHFHYRQQELGSPALFLRDHLGLSGPAYAVSTACTSSAKALVSARLLIRMGLCDAVLAGGVDSLCNLTLNGFTALESVAPELCQPMSVNRCGINIGEAAALFLLTRTDFHASSGAPVWLLGAGESSDAHHISAPAPDGAGAVAAMRAALEDAHLSAQDIGYLNLHGTATQKNDAMEALATQQVFPYGVAASSTKPLTGHTLGAAGATELGFCWLTLSAYNSGRLLPPHVWDGQADPALPKLDLVERGRPLSAGGNYMMSNSFAFGGNNISLIIGQPT